MALNKHNIIPLIESYYHTFTPLERTIADFFIHNTDEQDFSSKNVSRLLYVSEASLSRFAQKCGFHGYREFIYEYKQSLIPAPEENIPRTNSRPLQMPSFARSSSGTRRRPHWRWHSRARARICSSTASTRHSLTWWVTPLSSLERQDRRLSRTTKQT